MNYNETKSEKMSKVNEMVLTKFEDCIEKRKIVVDNDLRNVAIQAEHALNFIHIIDSFLSANSF